MAGEWTAATKLSRIEPRADYEVLQKGDLYRHERGRSRELVVYIHGFWGNPRRVGPVMETVWETNPDADVLVPKMPFGLRPHKPRGVNLRKWPGILAANLVIQVTAA